MAEAIMVQESMDHVMAGWSKGLAQFPILFLSPFFFILFYNIIFFIITIVMFSNDVTYRLPKVSHEL